MNDIEGQVIQNVQDLAGGLPEALDWTVDVSGESIVVELGDGSLLISVNNVEGNRPGVFQTNGFVRWEDIIGSKIIDLTPCHRKRWSTETGIHPVTGRPYSPWTLGSTCTRQLIRKATSVVSYSGFRTRRALLLTLSQPQGTNP